MSSTAHQGVDGVLDRDGSASAAAIAQLRDSSWWRGTGDGCAVELLLAYRGGRYVGEACTWTSVNGQLRLVGGIDWEVFDPHYRADLTIDSEKAAVLAVVSHLGGPRPRVVLTLTEILPWLGDEALQLVRNAVAGVRARSS